MRLTLIIDGEAEKHFNDLCKRTNSTPKELLKKALVTYDLMIEQVEKGHQVLIDDRKNEMFDRIEID